MIPKKEIEDIVCSFIKNCSIAFECDGENRNEIGEALTRNITIDPKGKGIPSEELKIVIGDSGLVYGGSGASRLCLFYKNTLAIKIDKAHPLFLRNKDLGNNNGEKDMLDGNMCELRNYNALCGEFPFLENTFLLPYYHHFITGGHFISVFPKGKIPVHLWAFSNSPYLKSKFSLMAEIFIDAVNDNIGFWKPDIFLTDYNVENDNNTYPIKNKMEKIEKFLVEFKEDIENTRAVIIDKRKEWQNE